MTKIAVCDDNEVMLDYVCKTICESYPDSPNHFKVYSYSSGQLLLNANKTEKFDVLFLDIQMPDIDGFETANLARVQSPNIIIIFMTSHDSLVFKSFDYQPFHFICKGDGQNISKDIANILASLMQRFKSCSLITLKLAYAETMSVMINEILYIQSDAHYMRYYLKDNGTVRMRAEMQETEEAMNSYGFIRIHRCFLVNPIYINKVSMQTGTLSLLDGTKLEIGRNFKQIFSEQYEKYLNSNYL